MHGHINNPRLSIRTKPPVGARPACDSHAGRAPTNAALVTNGPHRGSCPMRSNA